MRFYQSFVAPQPTEPNYLLFDGMTDSYCTSVTYADSSARSAGSYFSAAMLRRSATSIQLAPVWCFENLAKPGIRCFSGGGLFDPAAVTGGFSEAKRMMDVAIASAAVAASKPQDPSLLSQARADFEFTVGDYERRRNELEVVCKSNLQALQLSGLLNSERLK